MFPFKNKSRCWGLQTRLIVPIGWVLVTAVSQGIFSHFSTSRQMESLVNQRGTSVLEGLVKSVEEQRQTKEIFAKLIADERDIAQAVEKGDRVGLARLLVPLQTKLRLESIRIYTKNKREMLHRGGEKVDKLAIMPLVAKGLSGITQSEVAIGREGLEILVSSPIKSSRGIVGTIVVRTALNGKVLNQIKQSNRVDLALFREGNLAIATIDQPDVLRLLKSSKLTSDKLDWLSQELARYNFHVTAKSLGNKGLLIALVPTEDLVVASRQRYLLALSGTSVLVVILLWFVLLLDRDIAKPLQAMVAVTGDIVRGNYQRRVASGHIRDLNEVGIAINYLAQQLETQLTELTRQAFYDPLTNLPNRVLFLNQLDRILAGMNRRAASVAVLFVDLDGFKVINDSLGHEAGDRLLVAVSKRLKAGVRSGDIVARLGGDEFTILLEEIADESDAMEVAEQIIQQLQASFRIQEREVFVSCSIGIALSDRTVSRSEELLRNADAAMYDAKKRGKSRYRVFEPNMDSRAEERLQLTTELRRAIARQEFRVHYQPVVQLETGRIAEVEALVRWQHPRMGLISPAKFIPLAEETGLILPIGQWVLETACRQVQQWQLHYPSYPPLVVGVNLSAKEFQQANLVEKIARILNETGLSPHCLKLEITESLMMEQGDMTIGLLYRLKELGIGLAIDDFGTGFSALNYLKRFPVDTLKIDRSFIKGLGYNPEDTAIVHAVIAFAKALKLSVTAEGIETFEQLAQLRSLACDRGQGYYFAKPLASEAIQALMEEQMISMLVG